MLNGYLPLGGVHIDADLVQDFQQLLEISEQNLVPAEIQQSSVVGGESSDSESTGSEYEGLLLMRVSGNLMSFKREDLEEHYGFNLSDDQWRDIRICIIDKTFDLDCKIKGKIEEWRQAEVAASAAASVHPESASSAAIDGTQCVICYDQEAEYAVVPCGHKCLCKKCGVKCKQCPLCRSAMTSLIKVYGAPVVAPPAGSMAGGSNDQFIRVSVLVRMGGQVSKEVVVVIKNDSTVAGLRDAVGKEAGIDIKTSKKLALTFSNDVITHNPGKKIKTFGITNDSRLEATSGGFGGVRGVKKDSNIMKKSIIFEQKNDIIKTSQSLKLDGLDAANQTLTEVTKNMTALFNEAESNPKAVFVKMLRKVPDSAIGNSEKSDVLEILKSSKTEKKVEGFGEVLLRAYFGKFYEMFDIITGMKETADKTMEYILGLNFLKDSGVWDLTAMKRAVENEQVARDAINNKDVSM